MLRASGVSETPLTPLPQPGAHHQPAVAGDAVRLEVVRHRPHVPGGGGGGGRGWASHSAKGAQEECARNLVDSAPASRNIARDKTRSRGVQRLPPWTADRPGARRSPLPPSPAERVITFSV
jgi:hypothetical protein